MTTPLLFLFGLVVLALTTHNLRIKTILGLVWLLLVWLLAFTNLYSIGYVSPDELYFATETEIEFPSNRFLWLLINQFVGLGTDDVVMHMRVVNTLFLAALYLTAVRVFRSLDPLLIAFFLSYFAVVSALNFRDVAILLGTLLFVDKAGPSAAGIRDQIDAARRAIWPAIFVFLMRPIQSLMLLAAGFRWHYIAAGLVLALIILQTPIGTRYFYTFAYFSKNFEQTIGERTEAKGLGYSKPSPENIAFWTTRFLFAPDPVSSISRVGTDTQYRYGQIDLAFRALHRTLYFGLMLYLIMIIFRHSTVAYDVIRSHHRVVKFVIIYSTVYAIFNFGASHERIKLVIFMLLIYLIDQLRTAITRNTGQVA